MSFPRSSGVLLHPTSLPGKYGIGDLGDEAYHFVDFLAASGQSLWQVLPLGPTGYGDSPYQCFSAFAGNTLLVSPERLLAERLLTQEELAGAPVFPDERIDFGNVIKFKNEIFKTAFRRFKQTTDQSIRASFEQFSHCASAWLDDYALYRALKEAQNGKAWNEWESSLVRRDQAALTSARAHLHDEIEAQKFYQFLFFRQWGALKAYCREHHVKLVGDIPIFVARDSADVWMNPDEFKLDEAGNPLVVAGVPPDYFSATGQYWGNPIYNWDRMLGDGFRWWIERVRATLEIFDIVRFDHFRGFAASWEIPGGDQTAERGVWVNVPGRELFTAIKEALGDLPIIAEDLGVITPDVEALRDDFELPGMRILQYAFGGDARNHDLPHNYVKNSVAYTGTHDNDTTVGWFTSIAGEGSTRNSEQIGRERQFCLNYLNTDGHEIHWDFIRAVLSSVADTVIIPLQDLLGLDNDSRMNLPNSASGNWAWRYKAGALTDEVGERLKLLTQVYGREHEMGC
ncbi:MAG: 4-alpha-glucanotransferase [Acidobacteria bacterium]|nr:4-alpha-glucanotransferase [Acidobacteriota bacterium]